MNPHSDSAHEPQTMLTKDQERDASEREVEQAPDHPYLKVFGPDIGVIEFELQGQTVTIGRSEQADIRLPDPRASRAHAKVTFSEGRYTLEDVGSNSGTTVNRKRIQSHVLSHGDSAEIGAYVLQFRTHQTLPGAAAAAKRAKVLLQSQFSVLPSGIRLRFRTLEIAPEQVFESGDTLRIGQSGLLIPTPTPPGDTPCLELHLSWSGGKSKTYLGEVVGVIEEESTHWMCTKLHTVSKETHQATVDGGQPGAWIDVVST